MKDANFFNELGKKGLPGHLGIKILEISKTELTAELRISPIHMAPNGFLHAGTVVTLADTSAGYGCVNNLPEGSNGFTTIELKSNHIGTARDGTIVCMATMAHSGRTTQVWDAVVRHLETGKTIAIFRCTQMLLYLQN